MVILLNHKNQTDTENFFDPIMSTLHIENITINFMNQDVKFDYVFDDEEMNLKCIKELEFSHEDSNYSVNNDLIELLPNLHSLKCIKNYMDK